MITQNPMKFEKEDEDKEPKFHHASFNLWYT
jgi:hypothetical protein